MFFGKSPAFSRFLLWLIGLGYVAYLIISLAVDVYKGQSELQTITAILLIAVMAVLEVVLLIIAIKVWKKATLIEMEDTEE